MTLDRIAFMVAILFLIWWTVGSMFNRRRAATLARTIHHALAPLGRGARLRPVGTGAFQVEVENPADPLKGLSLLCLLEPRDFPLAWLWMRLRGHRDRIVLQATFRQPPARPVALAGPAAAAGLGLRRVTALRLQREEPHLHLAFTFGLGEEAEIEQAFRLVARLARGEALPA